MKKIEIVTGKATIVVVDVNYQELELFCKTEFGKKYFQNFIALGCAKALTDKQWELIVDASVHSGLYAHYVESILQPNIFCYDTATESGLSLLKDNGVVLENAIPKPMQPWQDRIMCERIHIRYEEVLKEWQKSQEQVWKNPQIFIKLKGAN